MGGVLAVNQGSVQEPRFVKLTYAPEGAVANLVVRRQGHHLRLRRPEPEAGRGDDGHEGRHGWRGRGDGRDLRHRRARAPGVGHDLHAADRQHDRWRRAAARRRLHGSERQDRRGAQHRRRGPVGARRCAVAGVGVEAGPDHRPRHADRCLHGCPRPRHRRSDEHRRLAGGRDRVRGRGRGGAGLGAPATEGLPQAARLDRGRLEEHRHPLRGRARRPVCSSRSSSPPACRGHTSTSRDRRSPRMAPTRRTPRAAPGSVSARSWPSPNPAATVRNRSGTARGFRRRLPSFVA